MRLIANICHELNTTRYTISSQQWYYEDGIATIINTVTSFLSYATFQGNIEMVSHKTGGHLKQVSLIWTALWRVASHVNFQSNSKIETHKTGGHITQM